MESRSAIDECPHTVLADAVRRVLFYRYGRALRYAGAPRRPPPQPDDTDSDISKWQKE
jgi:hypothetical protein